MLPKQLDFVFIYICTAMKRHSCTITISVLTLSHPTTTATGIDKPTKHGAEFSNTDITTRDTRYTTNMHTQCPNYMHALFNDNTGLPQTYPCTCVEGPPALPMSYPVVAYVH